jgi:hypothetical protein
MASAIPDVDDSERPAVEALEGVRHRWVKWQRAPGAEVPDKRPAGRPEDPGDLGEASRGVGPVVERHRADDDIDRSVVERQGRDVGDVERGLGAVRSPGIRRSPDGKFDTYRHLGDGETEVVMEDQDGALLEGEPTEGPLEHVAVVDGQVVVGAVRPRDRKDPHALGPTRATPGLGVAGVREDAMEPRLEAGRVTQGSELGPGRDQCGLDGVLRQVEIAEDPHRDPKAAVAHHARQGVERFRVAPLRLADQLLVHPSLHTVAIDPSWDRSPWKSVRRSLSVQSRHG